MAEMPMWDSVLQPCDVFAKAVATAARSRRRVAMACRAVDAPFEQGRERLRVIIKLGSLNCELRFHYAGSDIYVGLFLPNRLELIGAAAHQDLRVAAP